MRSLFVVAAALFVLGSTSTADAWATDNGSAYTKGQKAFSVGMSLYYFGFTSAFDYGFHEAISGGIGVGYQGHFTHYVGWRYRYNYLPVMGRAAFHPFNLAVLADKIAVREQLDLYVGLTVGYRIGWAVYRGSGVDPERTVRLGGFYPRELLGARWYFADNIAAFMEIGSGMGQFNGGMVFAF